MHIFSGRLALTVNETSAATGWSRPKLYKLMKAGELPYSVVGGRRVILPDDVTKLVQRNRVEVES
jgi:excisionase family DNA binding protein